MGGMSTTTTTTTTTIRKNSTTSPRAAVSSTTTTKATKTTSTTSPNVSSTTSSTTSEAAAFARRLFRLTIGWRGLQTFASDHAIHNAGVVLVSALWSGTNKNRDVSTGPLARPLARSLAPLTHSLAPHCSLHSRAPLRSLVLSLAYFAHSLARGKVNF